MQPNMLRNIVREILRECYPRKLKPNENFISFFVQLLLLDPNWGITENFMNSRSNVQNLVKYVITKLEAHDTKILTLKTQFYFTCNLQYIDNVTKCNRESILERLAPLKAEILSGDYTNQGYDNLRRNIAVYVTFVSGLGNPGLSVVLAEALAALRSIMSEVEAVEFTRAPNYIKEKQLEHLRKVLCGIRLFNKDSDKGGAGIENLPHLLNKAIRVVKAEIQSALVRIMERVNLFTLVVDKCYVMKECLGHNKMVCEIPIDVDPTFIDTMKGLLLMHRQNELFVRNIIELTEKMEEYVANLYQSLDAQLRETHKTVHMRLAVPVDVIFPLFETLSDLWSDFQDQVILLSKYNDIVNNLETYSSFVRFDMEVLELVLDSINNDSMGENNRSEESVHCQLVSQNEEVEILSLDSFANPEEVKLQYLGFCCWKLVETDGGLIPGVTNMGIAKFQNKYYAFSTPEACVEFCKKPGEYINHVLNLGRRMPEFIRFLDLMEELQQVIGTDMLVEEMEVVKVIGEKEVQFEATYVQAPHIEHKYKWNIWDLRREALVLANVSNCTTTSTQTLKNHSTQSIRTQTYLQKNKEVQTNKDAYTNVPKPKTFIFGLRGRRDDKEIRIFFYGILIVGFTF
ncbi:unnamed protein product [Phaedon cochleariae]|uniref:Cilia- and flagella-associated protein 206 n=1 Tax=Phaedon cochleariae TaxID=80249 RepID=A0A9N9SGV1_PHACE|nr:unnamed protein product [Phaedon cochleariae]